MNGYLKITRKRTFRTYLEKLGEYGMQQGFQTTEVNGLRWNRLQLCNDSVEEYLVSKLGLRCVRM